MLCLRRSSTGSRRAETRVVRVKQIYYYRGHNAAGSAPKKTRQKPKSSPARPLVPPRSDIGVN